MFVSGQGYSLLDPLAPSAINVNEGIIATGDNSSGMFTMGTTRSTYNSGSITTGNHDISAFQPHPEYTADEFAQLGYGVAASGIAAGRGHQLRHDHARATARRCVRAHVRASVSASRRALTQGEDGVIETGDDVDRRPGHRQLLRGRSTTRARSPSVTTRSAST